MTRHDRHAADAFRDAVRHILAEDGVFTLADRHDRTRFWNWNGIGWHEERVPAGRAHDYAASAVSTASPSSARR